MHTGGVLNIFGKLLVLTSLFLLLPIPFSIYYDDGMARLFVYCALAGAGVGALLVALFKAESDLGHRDGFAIVVLSWLGLSLLGALPFYLCGVVPSFIDCFFESMSGFTTTGSTILPQIEMLPKSVLFWRATTQFLGGMGIIVLSLAILPLLGVGGMQLFQAEASGPTKDRLTPRIQDTARILWGVYLIFNAVLIALLMLGGADFFNAVCHAFATIATGGFSPHSASIGFYNSVYIETVIIIFMFLGATSFALHHQALKGRFSAYWESEEFRFYLGMTVLAVFLITGLNYWYGVHERPVEALRTAAFQVVSLQSTCGFGTADFNFWPPASQVVLVILMLVGGSAGSTSGSIKTVRFLLFFKFARQQLRNLVHPHNVSTIKLGQVKVRPEVMAGVLGFFSLYLAVFVVASLMVTALGVDIVTATTAVITTLGNVGPGLNLVGPAAHFGDLPWLAKLILSFCMLAGRLELYTLAVLLTPDFWRMARRPHWRMARRGPAPEVNGNGK